MWEIREWRHAVAVWNENIVRVTVCIIGEGRNGSSSQSHYFIIFIQPPSNQGLRNQKKNCLMFVLATNFFYILPD